MQVDDCQRPRCVLPSRSLTVCRVFDAPRQLVFEALTKPEHLRHWWLGPEGWTLVEIEIDLRIGGEYRHVWQREIDGSRMTIQGRYLEVLSPSRIVCTEHCDAFCNVGERIATFALTQRRGKTTLTYTVKIKDHARLG